MYLWPPICRWANVDHLKLYPRNYWQPLSYSLCAILYRHSYFHHTLSELYSFCGAKIINVQKNLNEKYHFAASHTKRMTSNKFNDNVRPSIFLPLFLFFLAAYRYIRLDQHVSRYRNRQFSHS